MQKSSDSTRNIRISCQGADLLPLDKLILFQGNLKRLTKPNLEKLKTRIIQSGFCAPFFVWKYEDGCFILDGTQRRAALMSLQHDGYPVPPLPVVYIDAVTEAEARTILLSVASQYGEWVEEELAAWLAGVDAEIAETMRLVDKEISAMTKDIIGDIAITVPKEENDITITSCPKCGHQWQE